MSREIKFRAWDRKNRKMVNMNYLCCHKSGLMLFEKDHKPGKEFDFMQFTGLHDKNGKEIYEGDIVKHKQYVKYGELSGCVEKVTINPYNGVMVGDNSIGKECEVIGNIHENPDLMEVPNA